MPELRTKPTDLLNKIFPILAEFQSVGDDRNTQQCQPWARTAWYTPPGNGVTRVVCSLSLLTPGVGIQETIEKSQLLRDPGSHFLTIAF